MNRSIKVVDFTHGKKDSDKIDTNIPFTSNFAEAKTIQSANVVLGAYINKNIKDISKIENDTNKINEDITNINNNLNLKADKTEIPTKTSELTNDSGYITNEYHDATKQDVLISGVNIKTINNQDVLGEGNIEITASAIWGGITGNLHNQQDLHEELQAKADYTDLPTKTSELTNDSGYITNEYHDATKQDVINNLDIINNNLKYVSEEIVVGTYLNKPLYRKLVEISVNANNTLNTPLADLEITGQDIVLIDLGKSIARYNTITSGGGWSPISYYINSNDASSVYINTTPALVIRNNTINSREYKVVLEYTKIADSEVE